MYISPCFWLIFVVPSVVRMLEFELFFTLYFAMFTYNMAVSTLNLAMTSLSPYLSTAIRLRPDSIRPKIGSMTRRGLHYHQSATVGESDKIGSSKVGLFTAILSSIGLQRLFHPHHLWRNSTERCYWSTRGRWAVIGQSVMVVELRHRQQWSVTRNTHISVLSIIIWSFLAAITAATSSKTTKNLLNNQCDRR